MESRIKINDVWYVREDIQKKQPYVLGAKWSNDFDYEGMLEFGLEVEVDTSIDILEMLLDSFEDVNYHREAAPLYDLIEHRKYQNYHGESFTTKDNIRESLHKFKCEIEFTRDTFDKEELTQKGMEKIITIPPKQG